MRERKTRETLTQQGSREPGGRECQREENLEGSLNRKTQQDGLTLIHLEVEGEVGKKKKERQAALRAQPGPLTSDICTWGAWIPDHFRNSVKAGAALWGAVQPS